MKETVLVWLLRVGGVLLLTAFGAIFLPVSWMASSHRWLGLGTLPETPLVDYLTRSISAMYGIHGGVLLVAASDVHRFRPLIVYLGWMNVVFGVLMLGIDLHAGMPWYWTYTEGPPIFLVGLLLLYLVRSIEADRVTWP